MRRAMARRSSTAASGGCHSANAMRWATVQRGGVDAVGLRACHLGLGEAARRTGVDDHQGDGRGLVQHEAEVEAVGARGLQREADAAVAFALEPGHECGMSGGGVEEGFVAGVGVALEGDVRAWTC